MALIFFISACAVVLGLLAFVMMMIAKGLKESGVKKIILYTLNDNRIQSRKLCLRI